MGQQLPETSRSAPNTKQLDEDVAITSTSNLSLLGVARQGAAGTHGARPAIPGVASQSPYSPATCQSYSEDNVEANLSRARTHSARPADHDAAPPPSSAATAQNDTEDNIETRFSSVMLRV